MGKTYGMHKKIELILGSTKKTWAVNIAFHNLFPLFVALLFVCRQFFPLLFYHTSCKTLLSLTNK